MKIALFVHCFYPTHIYGTETYTLDLARNLQLLGHQPVVVSAVFPGEARQPELLQRYEHDGVPVISIDKNLLPNVRVKDTYYQGAMAPVLDAILDEVGPDVVHVTHLVNHTAVLLEVVARRQLPVVATFTDFFGFCYNNKLEAHDGRLCAGPATPAVNCLACHLKAVATARPDRWHADLMRRPFGAAAAARTLHEVQRLPSMTRGRVAGLVQDVLQRKRILMTLYQHYRHAIVPTAFIQEAYERNGFNRPITRIPFGIDIVREPKRTRDAARPLTLGFIGQLMAHKGTDLLVDAARMALDPADYEIRIYGSESQDPNFAAELRSRARGLPVRFLGTFAPGRMREVLDELDVLVIPSRWYENSPLVLLNALACHTPVIVSDVAGMTEFVRNGVNGYAFERGSAGALAKVLGQLGGNPEALQRLSAAASYEMSTLGMARRTAEVYEQVVATARQAG